MMPPNAIKASRPVAFFLERIVEPCRACKWLYLVVFAASMAITGQLWHSARQHELEELRANFDFRVRDAAARISERMHVYEQVLRGTSGFMIHAEHVDRTEYRRYIGQLQLQQNYPGIQGIAFVQLIQASQKERHVAEVRKEGFPRYSLLPAGERDVYSSVVYIEPFARSNLLAIGHDAYADPLRRAAMDKARDLDQAVITDKVTLDQDAAPKSGIVMYLPVYRANAPHGSVADRRANIAGWVSAVFWIDDLMAGVHGEKAAELDIEIFDGAHVSEQTRMHDPDHDSMKGKDWTPLFRTVTALTIANHTWTMTVHTLPRFEEQLGQGAPRVVAAAGVGISLMLALLTLMLTTSRDRALKAARELSKELIERESRYRQMFEGSTSMAYLVDPQTGGIVDANSAVAAFWGYPVEQLRQMRIEDINIAGCAALSATRRLIIERKTTRVDARHRLRNGQIRDVEVFIGPLNYHGKMLLYAILHDVSDRKRAEQALQESEARLREIAETLGEGVFVTDRCGMILFINPEAQRLLGWTEKELLGHHAHSLFHHTRPDGTPHHAKDCEIGHAAVSNRSFRSYDEAFWRKDGSMLPVTVNATPIVRAGAVAGAVVAFHDIVTRKQAEQALADESAKNLMLLRTGSDGVHVLDLDGNVVLVNDAFCTMLGYTREELQHMNVAQWDARWSGPELMQKLGARAKQRWLFESCHRHRDGTLLEVEIHVASVVIGDKPLLYASARDISERKKLTERVHYLANFDLLTDLPNRALLNDRLAHSLATARRAHERMALLFIDLDKFKPVNDTLGHHAGDLLLKEVAVRMRECVRESDTIARIGGDEFVVLLPVIESHDDAWIVREKIIRTLAQPFELAGQVVEISASIGIAVYPDDGADESALLRHADGAMYRTKQACGVPRVRQYDDGEQAA